MMCRFLYADFELSVKCPIDQTIHQVRFQAYPQLRGQALDVVGCDGSSPVEQLSCGKVCHGMLESGEYWQTIYPESAVYSQNQ